MRVSVVLAHPNPKSFNHAIAHAVARELKELGHEVTCHDLYAEKFDPILPFDELKEDIRLVHELDRHCYEIAEAEGIVIVHPNWWGQPPAILKGWVDRVLRPGVAYRLWGGKNRDGAPQGLLKARVAIVFNTSDTPAHREIEVFGDPLETLWKNCVFGLCGVDNFHRVVFSVISSSTEAQREAWLERVRDVVWKFFWGDVPVETSGRR